jgi:predicted HTH domain antitoxin
LVYGNRRCEIAVVTAAGHQWEESNLSEEDARLRALELYREDKVSLGRAAEVCHMPLAAFMDFAAKHGVPPLRYSFEDLEEERQSADRLKA